MLFAGFLQSKLGEELYQKALGLLRSSPNPFALLEGEGSWQLLALIGEENADCLKVFKFIVSAPHTQPQQSKPFSLVKAPSGHSPDVREYLPHSVITRNGLRGGYMSAQQQQPHLRTKSSLLLQPRGMSSDLR